MVEADEFTQRISLPVFSQYVILKIHQIRLPHSSMTLESDLVEADWTRFLNEAVEFVMAEASRETRIAMLESFDESQQQY